MARRLEVELTSTKGDGSWTWRAAGARQPKGEVPGALLYPNAAVGDVIKVEAEFHLDGIEVIEVFPPKQKEARSDLLELKARPLRDDELVTEVRAPGGRGRGDRRDRGEGRGERGPRREGEGRRDGRGSPRGAGRGGQRPARREFEDRPKPQRLRPGRAHRTAVLAEVPEEHRPIADQVMQGGLPAVRAAIEKQNAEAKASGQPAVEVSTVLAIAEPLVAKLRTAEWRDRADAALVGLADVDLRDLRSVVVASDAAARDEETRALAEQLRVGLGERVENDHKQWLADIEAAVNDGRTVRALRLSSRPVKAGAPLPTELAGRLTEAASAALAGDIFPDRWATVLDALAFTPIRSAVTPSGYPVDPPAEFLDAVRRVADRVPVIAAHYGIDPAEAEKARKARPPRSRKPQEGKAKPKAKRPVPGAEPKPAPAAEATEAESPAVEAIEAESPSTEVVEAVAPVTEPEASPADESVAPVTEPEASPADESVSADPAEAETVTAEPAEVETVTADTPAPAEESSESEPEADTQ